jgi:hypothetical protein
MIWLALQTVTMLLTGRLPQGTYAKADTMEPAQLAPVLSSLPVIAGQATSVRRVTFASNSHFQPHLPPCLLFELVDAL